MKFRRLLLFLLILIVACYAYIGLNVALSGVPGFILVLSSGLYLVCCLAFCFFVFSFQRFRNERQPSGFLSFLFLFAIGFFICQLLVALMMFLDDVRRGLTLIVQFFTDSDFATGHSVILTRTIWSVGILIWLALFLGTKNKYRYRVKRVKLHFDNLPSSFKGLKIVQISDIHSGSFRDKEAVNKGIEKILDLKPDLILFTGDLVNNLAEEIIPYKDIFSRLQAPMGVYSILGNHDYGEYVTWSSETDKHTNLERLKQHHADMGWHLMMNEHHIFERGKEAIALIGIENWSAKSRFPKYGRLSDAYSGLKPENPTFKILMSHDPSHWDAEIRPDYPDIDLTLSGHTHAMQFGFRLPGGFQWSPVQYMYRQWSGLYQKGKQYLYVNVGFGFLGYPGRFGFLPEITLFELF